MREDDLSHRGLFKLANAKLDYLIDLLKLEFYERSVGSNGNTLSQRSQAHDKYLERRKQIFNQDITKGE